jgi:hypothetical protein
MEVIVDVTRSSSETAYAKYPAQLDEGLLNGRFPSLRMLRLRLANRAESKEANSAPRSCNASHSLLRQTCEGLRVDLDVVSGIKDSL